MDEREIFTEAFWDERYAGSRHVWSGRPNQRLVEQVGDLEPPPGGAALDVGCGEGGDVVWLARRGWVVTGGDVSGVVLRRAAVHADESGVGDRTSWRKVDVLADAPLPSGFDLVSAAYVHVPPDDLASVYARIAAAVRPGGTLVVLGHHPDDAGTGLRSEDLDHLLMPPEAVVEALDPASWTVLVAQPQTREHVHEGTTFTVTDTVVRAQRR